MYLHRERYKFATWQTSNLNWKTNFVSASTQRRD